MKSNFKKIVALVVFTLILSTSSALVAQANSHNKQGGGFSGPAAQGGGFSGPGPQVVGIMDASKQSDDTWVTLKGKILNHVGDDKYTFQDASGQGIVEIDHEAWAGAHVGPNDLVELVTKVDKDWGHTELEVERVTKVQ